MWQTVSARIRGTKSELEELGEETDNILSTSKLRELVMGYTNVDIMKDKDSYKDIYTIISEIGEKWKDLKDIERAALLEGLAGKKQSNILAAVLNNVDRLKDVYQTAETSAGSAMKEQERYMESVQYSIDQLTAHVEEFWSSFINTSDVKAFIDMLNGIISAATKISSIFGALPIAAGVLATVLVASFVSITRTVDGLNIKLGITNTLLGGLPVIIGVITSVAVGLIGWGIAAADTSKQIEKLNEEIVKQQEEIDKLTQKEKDVTDLYKEYNALMTKSQAYGLAASEKENLLKISQGLVETYGLEVQGIDAVTGAYVIGTSAINDYVEALRAERLEKQQEQTETRRQRIAKNIREIIKDEHYNLNSNNIEAVVSRAKNIFSNNAGKQNSLSSWVTATELLWGYKGDHAGEAKKALIQYFQTGTEEFLDEFKRLASLDAAKIQSKTKGIINSVINDVITNIQVENADTMSQTGENILASMLQSILPKIEDLDEDKIKNIQDKVSEFAGTYGHVFDDLGLKNQQIQEKINSNTVGIKDYKDLLDNQMKQLQVIEQIFGDTSEEANAFRDQLNKSLENNVGLSFAQISKTMTEADLDTTKFDEVASTVLKLGKAMSDGSITFSEYVSGLKKNLKDVSLEETFKNDEKAAKSFFATLNENGKNAIVNLMAQYRNGGISQKDYLSSISDMISYFEELSQKATLFGENSELSGFISELKTAQTELNNFKNVVQIIPDTFEEFKNGGVKSVNALTTALEKAGITSVEIGGKVRNSAKEIADAMYENEKNYAEGTAKIADKFRVNLEKIGKNLALAVNKMIKIFGKIDIVITKPHINLWDWIKGLFDGRETDEMKFGVKIDGEADPDAWAKELGGLADELDFNFDDFTGGGGGGKPPYTPTDDDDKKSNGRDKNADPLKADIDRYVLLQNAVDEAEQSLKRLESTEDSLLGTDKLHNLEQQAEAYGKIAKAYNDMAWENKQERNDIRWRMEQNGFAFSGDFNSTNISTNYAENLQRMYDKYKAMPYATEADKDARAKYLEEIKDMEAGYEKILDLNKSVYDNENKGIDALKGQNEELENQRQYWEDFVDDQISDIEHQIDIRKSRVTPSFDDDISDYEKIKEIAHQRANDWRALGYDDNSEEVQKWQKVWLDADSSIWDKRREEFDKRLELSEDYIQHSKDFEWENGDNEIEARKRVLDWIQSDYYKSLIKDDKEYYKILEENRLKYREAVKEEFDKANDFANEFLDSQKTILQAQYDVENSVAEARHEINKELETSMTMYGYLEEETRQLLFNQEDYNKLSKELNNIEDEALRLQSEYEDKLHNSTLETVESITSEYQMQYETLMKSYEIAKADLEIAKKKQKLNNVLSERNVRMFINGSWQWVANTEDVINAKAELADAEYAKRVEEAGLTQQESINELTKKQDKLGVVIKQFENGIIDLEDAVSRATKAIGSMPSALSSSYSTVQSSSSSSSSYGGGSGGSSAPSGNTWATIPGLGKVSVHVDSNGNTTNRGLSAGTVVHTNGGDYKIVSAGTKGATYNPSSGYWSVKVKEKNADGTRYTSGGMTLMGEEGFEAYISANGRLIPINQPTIGNIPGGGVVFNTDQMQNLRTLWDMSNLNLNTDRSYINKQSQQVSQTTDNRIIINGMTVDSGSADGQALISALRRYVGNH